MDKFVRIMYENIQAKNIIAPRIALRGILAEMCTSIDTYLLLQ